ncbi:hypothetical protein L1987_53162 [Smallanthus sonchifolius]|uniref:Uncharacterized protein n=1 Tax=Smallanthus sonchifolius TaxID=185202 RepID=A0ACB9EVH1_9ASTR|nr:hypothetical protein L1987_53162 [Smallanthus sonchifolius]
MSIYFIGHVDSASLLLVSLWSDIVNALHLKYIVMFATVLTVIRMWKMSLLGERLLKLLWNSIKMHSGIKLLTVHMQIVRIYRKQMLPL